MYVSLRVLFIFPTHMVYFRGDILVNVRHISTHVLLQANRNISSLIP